MVVEEAAVVAVCAQRLVELMALFGGGDGHAAGSSSGMSGWVWVVAVRERVRASRLR